MIQSGGALGGHYYAFIQSFDSGKWFQFNDSSVRPLDEERNEFENAFGGGNRSGTGYVLLYRQSNLAMPPNYGYFPKYLERMVQSEDEEIRKKWEQWKKDMRTVTLTVHRDIDGKEQNEDAKDSEFESKENEVNLCEIFGIFENSRDFPENAVIFVKSFENGSNLVS